MDNAMVEARRRLIDGAYTCVVMADGWQYTSKERGVKPLLYLLKTGEFPRGAVAADKTVGAGAAYLYVLLGVRAVWARVISEKAKRVLETDGVTVCYDECVPYIINRCGDGVCPIEAAVEHADDATDAHRRIVQALAQLRLS